MTNEFLAICIGEFDQFTEFVTENADFGYKEVVYECSFFGEDGSEWGEFCSGYFYQYGGFRWYGVETVRARYSVPLITTAKKLHGTGMYSAGWKHYFFFSFFRI